MIIVEDLLFNGLDLVKTYSDKNMLILQEDTGNIYVEAVDIKNHTHTYSETDIPADGDDEITDLEAFYIIIGSDIP